MEWFLSLPGWLIIVLCVLAFVIPGWIVTKLVLSGRYKTDFEDNTVIGPAAGFLGTAFTFLLAFVIVNVWTGVADREQAMYDEFSTVSAVLLEVDAVDPGAKAEFLASLDNYVRAVITTEIDESSQLGGSNEANAAFASFLTLVDKEEMKLASNSQKAGETGGLFSEAQQLVEAREKRVATTGPEIGGVFAAIIILLGLMTVLSVAILPASSTRRAKWIQVMSVALATGLITSLVFYLSSTTYVQQAEHAHVEKILTQMEQHAS